MAPGAPTSLVLREHDGRAPKWVMRRASNPLDGLHCPRMPFDYLDVVSGALRPASCKSIRCAICGAFEVRRRAWRLATAEPKRFLTLTSLNDDFQKARRQEKRFLELVRGEVGWFEWAVAHELTSSGHRHAHALCKGSYLPQRRASQFAERAGMGYVTDIRAIRNTGATSYALKEALRVVNYATKGTDALGEHLDLNGGRLCRTTRGYFKT
jgi:hypothetical protein